MVSDVPFTFDPVFYRNHYPELPAMSDADAESHFRQYGSVEGRQGSPAGSRADFIACIADAGEVLEIGPFCNPTVRGPHVKYLDVLTSAQLRQRAVEIGLDAAGCPEIDYVGDIEQVQDQFDAVVSSHAIEHQLDLVYHLRNVERLLRPNGRFMLFVPDKRYCFDHFIAESTIADVLDAHRHFSTVHRLKSVVEHGALITHNDAIRHWRGDHGEQSLSQAVDRIRCSIQQYDANPGGYIDVHAWYFTPTSFFELFEMLFALGLSTLRVSRIFPTLRDTLEFFVVMERS